MNYALKKIRRRIVRVGLSLFGGLFLALVLPWMIATALHQSTSPSYFQGGLPSILLLIGMK